MSLMNISFAINPNMNSWPWTKLHGDGTLLFQAQHLFTVVSCSMNVRDKDGLYRDDVACAFEDGRIHVRNVDRGMKPKRKLRDGTLISVSMFVLAKESAKEKMFDKIAEIVKEAE